ncbi:MOSC domain-containing protein [Halocatena pleomorpha]|uniref:MOSC domain-containing protein n=1 Tax=Halocatena pleomorpha TaxID=1785090 RepID=A0A3P3R980_9EURY|nr:MOSC domain-containing protein [Halocatena pleomorpha]RRJ29220.1 MOSC domain-containing protein [Halocatena pleomorpha]
MSPELVAVRRYPIKSLDPESCERARLVEGGRIELDREYAIVDRPATAPHPDHDVSGSGGYLNGKRTDAVHRIRSSFDPDTNTVTLWTTGSNRREQFDMGDRTALNAWLSEYFRQAVSVRRTDAGGYPDDRVASGPTVISTATLRTVASWFPDIDVEEMRRRFRANLEIGGVPAFWEDRLYADHGEYVAFRIGDVRFQGINPCQRCVVPTRDPDTGERTPEFRTTFVDRRQQTLPAWVSRDRFDHYYRLMVNTRVPDDERYGHIAVGDPIEILRTRAA